MPVSGTTIFSDSADYQAGFRGAKINLVFTGPGVFCARVTSVRLPHLRLFSVEESLPRIAFVSLPGEWLHFAFVVAPSGPSIWAGLQMQSLDLMVHSVGEHLHQQTGKGYKWSIISVAPEFFASTSKALTGSTIFPPQVGRIQRASRADAGELQRHHQEVCRFAEAKPQALTSREVARAIEHDFVYALINCLTAEVTVQGDTLARRRHSMVMNRFEDLLAAKFDRQLPIAHLCEAIGVAERSLRMCCFEFLSMSPGDYMRLRRLNLVRVALQHPPLTANVSEVAGRYGFTELGRFAAYYRTIFGETPSDTVRRSRSRDRDAAFAGIA